MIDNRSDTICFKLGILAPVPLLLFLCGIHLLEQVIGLSLPPCQFQQLAHIPCPGCGGTRALRILMTGHPVQSFLYHPAVLYMAFAYTHFMGRCLYHKYVAKDWDTKVIPIEPYFYGMIAVCLIQWVVKLGLLAAK